MAEEANTDELSAFVSSTLKAIAAGIEQAQGTLIQSAHGTGVSGFAAPTEVQFDIAVAAKSTGAAGGGFKISVFGIGANLAPDIGSENSTISRIKFAIPTKFKSNAVLDAAPVSTSQKWS